MKRCKVGGVGRSWAWVLALAWTAWTPTRAADEVAIFRLVAPATTEFTAVAADGTVVWSNAVVGTTGIIQRAQTLTGTSNWVDYVWSAVTGMVMTVRLFDPNPPSGMVLIPGGVNAGMNPLGVAEDYDPNWYPQNYTLAVTSVYMDRCEVTKARWDEVYTWGLTHGYTDLAPGAGKAADHPVQGLNWYDCVKWCNARSQMEGRRPAYYTSSATNVVYTNGVIDLEDDCVNWRSGYRLPTDPEWEYAARAGATSKRFPWGGDTISHDQANYYAANWAWYDLSGGGWHPSYATNGVPYTSPVGAFEAGKNVYGLYDMAGNVREWCWSWCPGYEGVSRELRGGGWSDLADYCRVGNRVPFDPGSASDVAGFRTVLPPGSAGAP